MAEDRESSEPGRVTAPDVSREVVAAADAPESVVPPEGAPAEDASRAVAAGAEAPPSAAKEPADPSGLEASAKVEGDPLPTGMPGETAEGDAARMEPSDGTAPTVTAAPPELARPFYAQKSFVAIAVFVGLVALPHAVPGTEKIRIGRLPWESAPADTTDVPEGAEAVPAPAPAASTGETSLHAAGNQGTVANALPETKGDKPALDPEVLAKTAGSLAIEDPTGHALDAFYKHLAATEKKEPGAVTRILHYGDSVITSDYISGTLRRRLQAKFGDGGHGYILVANPWEWYFHNDVVHYAGEGWNANRITGPFTNDKMYGLGGVTFHGAPGATATFGATEKGDYGRNVSRFDVYYMSQPQGGDFEVKSGDKVEKVSTKGDKASKVFSFRVEDGSKKMVLRAAGGGDVRLFGVALERDVPGAEPPRALPGVVYDALGANGAQSLLWEPMDDAHWKDQMALRKPALVVLQFGTNESEAPTFGEKSYEKTVAHVLEKVIAAAEGASVMLAAPLDRAENQGGALHTKKIIPKIVASQRKVALAHGCAFWNTYEAMGGEGSMAKWVRAKPQLASGDLTHPTPAGAEVIGELFDKALVTGFEAYKSRSPAAAADGGK